MTEETAAQPVKDDAEKASEIVHPVVDKNKKAPVAAKAKPSAPKKQAATAAVVKKVAPKPKMDKKVVAKKPTEKAIPEKTTPTAKTPAKTVKKTPVVAKGKIVEDPKEGKQAKPKKQAPRKPKLVRDSFTIPESDYALFATLKQRALAAGIEVKKSELLRASLIILAGLDDGALAKAIGQVNRIKTGRPKK